MRKSNGSATVKQVFVTCSDFASTPILMLFLGMWNYFPHVSFSGHLRSALLAAVRYHKTNPLFAIVYSSFSTHLRPLHDASPLALIHLAL